MKKFALLFAAILTVFLFSYCNKKTSGSSDLELEINTESKVSQGDRFHYVITVKNNGETDIEKVHIQNHLPEEHFHILGMKGNGICSDDSKNWIVDIKKGEAASLDIELLKLTNGPSSASATVASKQSVDVSDSVEIGDAPLGPDQSLDTLRFIEPLWSVQTKEQNLVILGNNNNNVLAIVCDLINLSNCLGFVNEVSELITCLDTVPSNADFEYMFFKTRELQIAKMAGDTCDWKLIFPPSIDISCIPDSIGETLCTVNLACVEFAIHDDFEMTDAVLEIGYVDDFQGNGLPLLNFRRVKTTGKALPSVSCYTTEEIAKIYTSPGGAVSILLNDSTIEDFNLKASQIYLFFDNGQLCFYQGTGTTM